MSELDVFLSELRQAGAVHSDGAFTVSLQTAEEKLQRFALSRPELYIVQLVAAAVASGASFLRITSDLSQLELLSDGAAPTKEQLESLNSFLFYTVDAPDYLSELAVGAYGALAYPVKKVIIESFTEGQAWQLELRGKKQRLRPLELNCPIIPLLRVVIDKGFGLRTRLTDTHPEQRELSVCRHAPLDLTFDDKVLARPLLEVPAKIYAWAALQSGQDSLRLTARQPALLKRHLENATGYLCLTEPGPSRSRLPLILHGVEFVHQGSRWGPANLAGVVHVKGLRKDISRTNLVENREFEQLARQLGEIGWELLAQLCHDPEATRAVWPDLQGPVAQALGRSDLPEGCRATLTHWMRVAGVAKVQGAAGHLEALSQAMELENQGLQREAGQLRREVLQSVCQSMINLLQVMNLEAMADLVEPLRQALAALASPQLSRGLQACDILHALLGRGRPSQEAFALACRWGIHRLGLLLRYQGRLVEAAEVHARGRETIDLNLKLWAYRYCAEIELAQANYSMADEMLAKAHHLKPSHRDLAEERAFLKRLVSPEGRTESVALLRAAAPGRDADPFVQWLLLDWLVREGRSVLPWADWVELRARASMLELGTKLKHGSREEVEERLDHRFDLLGWQSLALARQRRVEAVEIAEAEFGPLHSYTQFSRRRAVYQLHRLEAQELADRLQCRGHLLAQLHACLTGLEAPASSAASPTPHSV